MDNGRQPSDPAPAWDRSQKVRAAIKAERGACAHNQSNPRDLDVKVVPEAELWAMKRAAQARDRALLASGAVPAEAMLLLRPEQVVGAQVQWPDPEALDD